MSLTYNTSVTLPGQAKQTALVPNANEVCVGYSTPAFRIFNLATGAQVGSTVVTTASPEGMMVVGNGASALCAFTTTGNWQMIQLSTGYITTYTGGSALNYSDHNQQMDYDPVNNIAMGLTGGSGVLNKFNVNTFALSTVTVSFLSSAAAVPTCIYFKGNGRFLVGTNLNFIVEIDSSGVVYNIFKLPLDYLPKQAPANTTNLYPIINNISFWNDILFVVTKTGNCYQISYTTGDVLYKQIWNTGIASNPSGAYGCAVVSGIILMACAENQGVTGMVPVFEVDISVVPFQVRSHIWLSATASVNYSSVGINPLTGNCWAGSTSDSKLWLFNIAAKSYTNIFVQLFDPPGTAVSGEVIMYDETDDVPVCDVIVPAAGCNVSVPTGKLMMQVSLIYNGTDTKVDWTEFQT